MKKRILALAIGLLAVGAIVAPAYAAKKCVPIRCTYDKVTGQKRCTSLCPGGSLLL